MSTNLIDDMTEREAKAVLNDICTLLDIPGSERTALVIRYIAKQAIIIRNDK